VPQKRPDRRHYGARWHNAFNLHRKRPTAGSPWGLLVRIAEGSFAMMGVTRSAACGLIGFALVLAGPTSSGWAQNDDESFDQKILSNILGTFGLRNNQGDIDYKERSPLVLPPRVNLPQPQPDPATTVRNWPVDPDVKRRKTEQRKPRDDIEESRTLRPSELNVGDRQRSRGPASPEGEAGRPENPRQLGYGGGVLNSIWGGGDKPVEFKEEPPRASLTEPPVGYQTPSPNAPYQGKTSSGPAAIPSFWDFGTDRK
jgi:hypothetical protein